MMEKDGNAVTDERLMHGLPFKRDVLEPQCFLFIDEVGRKLDSNDDHIIGGKKFIKGVEKDHNAARCNYNDCGFTMLAFTASNGQHVMDAMTIKAERLTCEKVVEVDMQSPCGLFHILCGML